MCVLSIAPTAEDVQQSRRLVDKQEMSVLCLRILQTALVYVNTLLLPDLLAHPEVPTCSPPRTARGLTPLFWPHVLTTAR